MLELISSKFAATTTKKISGRKYRKEIMTFGTYQDPNPWNWGEEDELWEVNAEYCQQVIDNFKAGAVESVKVIVTHDEGDVQIVGTIIDLELTDRGLDAILEIQDEEMREKIDTVMGDGKSLASGVSVGISEMFPRARVEPGESLFWDGPVLRHLAIVTIPWIQGMRQWEKLDKAAGHTEKGNRPLFRTEEVIETMKFGDFVKALATKSGKSEDEVKAGLEALGVTEESFEKEAGTGKGKGKKKNSSTPDAESVERLLSMLSGIVDSDEDEDEDDDEGDEGDEPKGKNAGTRSRSKKTKNAGTKKTPRRRSRNAGAAEVSELVKAQIEEAMGPLADQIKTLGTALQGGLEQVKKTQEQQRDERAASAVQTLVDEGKVLPAKVEYYKNLHLKDEELFEELTKDLPVIVDFGDDQNRGEGGYVNPATKGKKLSAEDAGKEADRYLGMITPSTAGRGDKVSSMTKKD